MLLVILLWMVAAVPAHAASSDVRTLTEACVVDTAMVQTKPSSKSGSLEHSMHDGVPPDQPDPSWKLSSWSWQSIVDSRWLLPLSKNRKLMFCLLPKNAATEFLSLVMRLDGNLDPSHWNPIAHAYNESRVHYDDDRWYLFVNSTEADKALVEDIFRGGETSKAPGWTRAVFLRNPVRRLLSAYGSKVKEGLFGTMFPSTDSFEDFVTKLEKKGVDRLSDAHLRPQSYTCGLNETVERFNFIGSFDDLNGNAWRMVETLGGRELAQKMLSSGWGPYSNMSLFEQPREVRGEGGLSMSVTHSEQKAADLQPDLVARIRKIYAIDYDLLQRAQSSQLLSSNTALMLEDPWELRTL